MKKPDVCHLKAHAFNRLMRIAHQSNTEGVVTDPYVKVILETEKKIKDDLATYQAELSKFTESFFGEFPLLRHQTELQCCRLDEFENTVRHLYGNMLDLEDRPYKVSELIELIFEALE